MERINIDRAWTFRRCFLDTYGMLEYPGEEVNLPHDAMIGTAVSKDAPANVDSGFFMGCTCSYTKYLVIPEEWTNDKIGLYFDGAMMHTTIDINGYKISEHHYGYTPFYVDITDYVSFDRENRITININTGVQPSSRWYTGAGLIRSVSLCHSPKVYIPTDGINVYTKEVTEDTAFLKADVEVGNDTQDNCLAKVSVELWEEGGSRASATAFQTVQINRNSIETAQIALNVKNPKLWDEEHPNLYVVKAKVENTGIYRTHFIKNDMCTCDETSSLFGIRTITVDAVRGLRINNRTVKLKGGCVHHDNGLLGAISLYESEARKVKKLKEVGFNAIRTAHNPPSAALVEACDRLGMYIFDEAFDSWGMAKRPGDFSMYFNYLWEQEMSAFMRRDRIHPSVIMWSTGNEIPERGGLNNGYSLAGKLANTMRSLDGTRPVSNGVCSFWCGLDDHLAKYQSQIQNAKDDEHISWENLTEPFVNGLDVVGYNYLDDEYVRNHELFPDRVILGSENFPKEIGFRWPVVEKLPYVIGDFTWTAWDYIGEAGIGKSVFVEPGDPLIEKGPWAIMPQATSPYPWRLANDADYDITGKMLPQGAYRSVVWGSSATHIYVQHPKNYGKVEIVGMWGFIDVIKSWNFTDYLGKPIEITVFSKAEEVELIINGKPIERKPVAKEKPLPNSVKFVTEYVPGKVEAISYIAGAEVSRDAIVTTKEPVNIVLTPEKKVLKADGHDLTYVEIKIVDEDNRLVPDAEIALKAYISTDSSAEKAYLAGFGTGNPVTEEDYTDEYTVTHRGRGMAVIRSGYEKGEVLLRIESDLLRVSADCKLTVE